MSTKSTLYFKEGGIDDKHNIDIHAYLEMHESPGIIKFDIGCSTCYCNYSFILTKHLGEQLINLLKEKK